MGLFGFLMSQETEKVVSRDGQQHSLFTVAFDWELPLEWAFAIPALFLAAEKFVLSEKMARAQREQKGLLQSLMKVPPWVQAALNVILQWLELLQHPELPLLYYIKMAGLVCLRIDHLITNTDSFARHVQ